MIRRLIFATFSLSIHLIWKKIVNGLNGLIRVISVHFNFHLFFPCDAQRQKTQNTFTVDNGFPFSNFNRGIKWRYLLDKPRNNPEMESGATEHDDFNSPRNGVTLNDARFTVHMIFRSVADRCWGICLLFRPRHLEIAHSHYPPNQMLSWNNKVLIFS